jgi:hypothetical protein
MRSDAPNAKAAPRRVTRAVELSLQKKSVNTAPRSLGSA